MIHVHYYIEAGAVIDTTTRVYCVRVGSSKQAQRDFLYLTAHAVDCGHYFEMRSTKTLEFVDRVLHSVVPGSLTIQPISARNLVRSFRMAESVPLSSVILHQQHQLRNVMDTTYRITSNLNRREATNCQAVQR